MTQPGRCDFCMQRDHDLERVALTRTTLLLCPDCLGAWLDRWRKQGLHL